MFSFYFVCVAFREEPMSWRDVERVEMKLQSNLEIDDGAARELLERWIAWA